MSEQYYYLLDGKEQGPFSRAAIEGLLKSGKLGGAFVRSGSDQPWQLPEEAGFKAEAISHVAAALASPAPPDPAAVVFRSQREIKESMSSGVGGTFAAAAVVLGLIGGGVWWMHTKPSQGTSLQSLTANRENTLTQEKGGYVLKTGVHISEIPDGSYEFSVKNPDFGGKPALEFRINIRKPNASLQVKRHVRSGRYIESDSWEEFRTNSGVEIGTVIAGYVDKNQCLAWKATTPTTKDKVNYFRQVVMSTGADPDQVAWHRFTVTDFAICVAKEDASIVSSNSKMVLFNYLNQVAPGTAPGADDERTLDEFSIQQGQLMGLVHQLDVEMENSWMGRIGAVNNSNRGSMTQTAQSPRVVERAAASTGPAQESLPLREQLQGRDGHVTDIVTSGIGSEQSGMQTLSPGTSLSQTSVKGRYRCFRADTELPGCVFEPSRDELERLSKTLGFDTEEFSDLVFTNKRKLGELLAPKGQWKYESCLAGGIADLQLQDVTAKSEDGGVFVYATLSSFSSRTGPTVLPTEQQPEGCDPSISGLD